MRCATRFSEMGEDKVRFTAVDGGHETLLVKAREAARLLAISQRLLWELTNRGEIPCVRLNRSVRYSIAELRRLATNGTAAVPATPEGDAS